jgi:hypothetical protein
MPLDHDGTPGRCGGAAAFLDVRVSAPGGQGERVHLEAALLVLDEQGLPLEFVTGRTVALGGPLWPRALLRELGTPRLAHALFDACRLSPALLVCATSMGAADWCRDRLAPRVPLAMAAPGEPPQWSWVGPPPPAGSLAEATARALAEAGYLWEPFERLQAGLAVVYPPDAPEAAHVTVD